MLFPRHSATKLSGPLMRRSERLSTMVTSREIRLKSRPVGMPSAENFELATVTVPDPAQGEVQVKNIWMTVDPYMRGRMVDRASYVPPFQLGEPLQGGAISLPLVPFLPAQRCR